jgi:hypothetical protein
MARASSRFAGKVPEKVRISEKIRPAAAVVEVGLQVRS